MILTSIQTTLVDGFANAFVEVAKGTTTFADAFRNMTIQILADIAAVTMKMAIFKDCRNVGGVPPMGVSMIYLIILVRNMILIL